MKTPNSQTEIRNPDSGYILLKKRVEELLIDGNFDKQVSKKAQYAEIEALKKTIDAERFFFVINLVDIKIEHAHGVHRWLGYPEKDWNIYSFYQSIHPAHAVVSTFHVYHSLGSLLRGEIKIGFLTTRYASTIALRHRDGHYLLLKRLVSAFQYDSKNRLLEYMNEFTIIGQFNNEPYTFRTSDHEGNRYNWEQNIAEKIRKDFLRRKFFSAQEMHIICIYAFDPEVSTEEICSHLHITRNTLITYHRRIAAKALKIFSIKFLTVKEIAQFIKAEGLI